MATGDWFKDAKNVKGLLCDIFGVLYDSGPTVDVAIEGSVEAIGKLKSAGVPMRFCSNTSTQTKSALAQNLATFGFDIEPDAIFNPPPAVCSYIRQNDLRPFLVINDGVKDEFSGLDQSNPNCVVLGDATDNFSYANLNKAFQILIDLKKPVLITMGSGKYYHETDGMKMDVGPYAKALEFACDVKSEVIGKPAASYFDSVLADLGISSSDAVMIGDDIVSDVGGAQACGMKGVQVRTGKYRPSFEPHTTITPDGYVDNLLQAAQLFLQHRC